MSRVGRRAGGALAPTVSQFTGGPLTRPWLRRFILGTLLQSEHARLPAALDLLGHWQTSLPATSESDHGVSPPSPASAPPSSRPPAVDGARLLYVQNLLSKAWAMPVAPIDGVSRAHILRQLTRYAVGEGTLEEDVLRDLNLTLRLIHRKDLASSHDTTASQSPVDVDKADNNSHDGSASDSQLDVMRALRVEYPTHMLRFLESIKHVAPGDNPHRAASEFPLRYPATVEALLGPHLDPRLEADGADVFDVMRETCAGPAYAIDSATTSEVDDAIGVEVDPQSGAETFVVYVSDATVYCPVGSPLEQLSARALATTTYLPERVYFMLPRPIIERATLREDRPCRTFHIRFRVDPTTAALSHFRIAVGWLHQLRRITYDAVQRLLDHGDGDCTRETNDSGGEKKEDIVDIPSWVTPKDVRRLRRIYDVARLRFARRMAAAPAGHAIDANLPEPYVSVRGTRVVSVEDQVIHTQAARLAVAELMIAANEVCSRVAQEGGVAIPFRGTRLTSADHEVAQYYREPQGVQPVASLDRDVVFFAEAMQKTVRRLSGVTRAIYAAAPLYHGGLCSAHYCHSTSPLRRYADMLVHHQLKLWLWRQHRGTHALSSFSSSPFSSSSLRSVLLPEPLPDYAMAAFCNVINERQEQSSWLQDNSTRFWVLRYVEQLLQEKQQQSNNSNDGTRKSEELVFLCLLGNTLRVDAAPEYDRFRHTITDQLAALTLSSSSSALHTRGENSRTNSSSNNNNNNSDEAAVRFAGRWRQVRAEYTYVSDVYIPQLQLALEVFHGEAAARVGCVVECVVRCVVPALNVLELELRAVRQDGDERFYQAAWMGGAVASLDA